MTLTKRLMIAAADALAIQFIVEMLREAGRRSLMTVEKVEFIRYKPS